MKLIKFRIIILLFALARSSELNAYALFRNKKPSQEVGLVWVKNDKGKKYVLLARSQEHGGLRGKADVYSFTQITAKDKVPANVKVFAQDDTFTIYERHSTAWHKPKYHRWTYSWVPMEELKQVAVQAAQSDQFAGYSVKTKMQEAEGKHYEVLLDPLFVQLLAGKYGQPEQKSEEKEESKKGAE